MVVYELSRLTSRYDLPGLLKGDERQYLPFVEIGVDKGLFAEQIVRRWPGIYIGVDPWGFVAGYPERHRSAEDMAEARRRISLHKNVKDFILLQMTSSEAFSWYSLNVSMPIGMVYIDGNHLEDYVFEDLCLWSKLVVNGGYICGHDIICPNEVGGGWGPGIQKALSRYADEIGRDLTVYLLRESSGEPWSFYFKAGI
ncbi:MAG: hypothetical protein KatS3mg087_1171 [Patescibacteria group bacterium]|nr:MAG: hypothetical protein KatS3mg087_1171 [Patescibacteria group bacterium]